jgi:hypothetical protein
VLLRRKCKAAASTYATGSGSVGAETMYPDYRKKLKDKYVKPEKCDRYCCGPVSDPALKCIRDGTGKER